MWNHTTYNFGEVKPKQALKAEFEYLGPKKITEVKPACGCTTSKKEGNIITLNYESPTFPNHLKGKGLTSFDFSKSATIIFDDNSKDVITIKGTIKTKEK